MAELTKERTQELYDLLQKTSSTLRYLSLDQVHALYMSRQFNGLDVSGKLEELRKLLNGMLEYHKERLDFQ